MTNIEASTVSTRLQTATRHTGQAAGLRYKPDFIIIGAQKAGTTSLHYYLDCHPEIGMSRTKELKFFVREMNWKRGWGWYQEQFPEEGRIFGEASPQYTQYPNFQGVPERIHQHLPRVKLIYVLRDPIERTISHYLQRVSEFAEERSFEQILTIPLSENNYLNTSRYYFQLEQYLPYFGREQFFFTTLERLRTDRRAVLRELFRFLEVEPDFYDADRFNRVLNDSRVKKQKSWFGRLIYPPAVRRLVRRPFVPHLVKRTLKRLVILTGKPLQPPPITSEMLEQMASLFREDVARLREFTGLSFQEWKHHSLYS